MKYGGKGRDDLKSLTNATRWTGVKKLQICLSTWFSLVKRDNILIINV